MLAKLELTPLDAALVAEGGRLAGCLNTYNKTLARLLTRFQELAGHRHELADFEAWADRDWTEVNAAHSIMRRESWDALVELRRLVDVRDSLLTSMRQVVGRRLGELAERREAVVARVCKEMAKVRKEFVQASPTRGESHFMDTVLASEPVAANRQITECRTALESLADLHRRVVSSVSDVGQCQRELLAASA